MSDGATRDQVAAETPDLLAERVERLRALFPEAFVEGTVDFADLREVLGEAGDDRPERYLFTWAGNLALQCRLKTIGRPQPGG